MSVVGRWSKLVSKKRLCEKAPYLWHLTVTFPLLAILAVLLAVVVVVGVYRLTKRRF